MHWAPINLIVHSFIKLINSIQRSEGVHKIKIYQLFSLLRVGSPIIESLARSSQQAPQVPLSALGSYAKIQEFAPKALSLFQFGGSIKINRKKKFCHRNNLMCCTVNAKTNNLCRKMVEITISIFNGTQELQPPPPPKWGKKEKNCSKMYKNG